MQTLTKIQSELKVPKDKKNKFGDFYYRNIEVICNVLKPLLVKYNASIYFDDAWETVGNSEWLHTTLHYIHDDTHLEIHASAKLDYHKGMSKEQCCGSCMSYTHKYAMSNLLLIDDNITEACVEIDSMPKKEEKEETLERLLLEVNKLKTQDEVKTFGEKYKPMLKYDSLKTALRNRYNALSAQTN